MDNLVEKQLGNYRLTRFLGRGGFAHVYLGEHIYLKTQAALKVLHVHLTPDTQQSFLHEAQTIAHLEHPSIVRVLKYGVEGDVPFLVMQYAPQGTLRQRYPRGTRVPADTVLPYVQQIASALDYAHQHHLIHRDIKSENMLLGRNNEVLLSDFGLVQLARSTGSQSKQALAGTFAYMAPEQLQGKPRQASDQYALGIVVYEWLSGSLPFQGNFAEIASQHLLTPPPPLAMRIRGISPDLEQVVFKALAKEARERFANVEAFANAFAQTLMTTEARSYFTVTDVGALKADPAFQPPGPSQVSTKAISSTSGEGNLSALETPPYQTLAPQHGSTVSGSTVRTPSPLFPSSYQTQPPAAASPSQHASMPFSASTYREWHPVTPESQSRPKPDHRLNANPLIIVFLLLVIVSGGTVALVTSLNRPPQPGPTRGNGTRSTTGGTVIGAVTPTPSAISLASVIPANWREKDDPLSNNSQGYGWEELSNLNKACQFQNGDYQVQEVGFGGAHNFAFCQATNTNYSDFAFEVQMKASQGTAGGIVFRAGTNGEYYFAVGNQDNTTTPLFVKDCPSSAPPCRTLKNITSNQLNGLFHKGPSDLNSLAVMARGDSFTFFVNEQEVAQLTDNTYSQGQIGLGVGTASLNLTGGTDEMRNAKIWTP